MAEWIDPRYAETLAVWKRTQQPRSRDPQPQPKRVCLVPPKG